VLHIQVGHKAEHHILQEEVGHCMDHHSQVVDLPEKKKKPNESDLLFK